jgi:hypothetical protein
MDGLLLGPMASYHFDRSKDFNEINPGIGYMTKDGWGGGVYKNSYNRPSFYAGKEMRYPVNGLLDAALTLGAVTGYPAKDVLPMVLPSLIGKLGQHEMALMLQPPMGPTKGALGLQYRYRLK